MVAWTYCFQPALRPNVLRRFLVAASGHFNSKVVLSKLAPHLELSLPLHVLCMLLYLSSSAQLCAWPAPVSWVVQPSGSYQRILGSQAPPRGTRMSRASTSKSGRLRRGGRVAAALILCELCLHSFWAAASFLQSPGLAKQAPPRTDPKGTSSWAQRPPGVSVR